MRIEHHQLIRVRLHFQSQIMQEINANVEKENRFFWRESLPFLQQGILVYLDYIPNNVLYLDKERLQQSLIKSFSHNQKAPSAFQFHQGITSKKSYPILK